MSKHKRDRERKRRAAFQIKGEVGFFDRSDRNAKLSQLGDPLEKLNAEVNWEIFRADLAQVYAHERKSLAGRKPIDPVLMFKIVTLQRLYNLSDDQTEYQIRDRATFQRFLGLQVEDGSPDAKTIWTFKERIKGINLTDVLFARFDAELGAHGLLAKGGQIVDAVIVEVPRQRNTPEENKLIKEGQVPAEWLEQPAKLAQKDLDARWTKKRGETYYGYKNHINIDQEHKLIRSHEVTDASVHDSQVLDAVLDAQAKDRAVYADSAYRSAERERWLSENGLVSKICERAYRNCSMTETQTISNKGKSVVRARVEHIFGFMHNSMNGVFIRSIGIDRATMHIGLMNLTYNFARFAQIKRKERMSMCVQAA
jgi:IS5 family transposase